VAVLVLSMNPPVAGVLASLPERTAEPRSTPSVGKISCE
jgi:hypothetical protein